MNPALPALITIDQLTSLYQTGDLVIIDASAGKASRERYHQSHLDGALYVDLDTQLADIKPDASFGGRHPLPSPAKFSETLSAVGIDPKSHVIIYDDKNGSNAAARLWWMLKSAGHAKVQVLDGGFDAAIKAGFPVNSNTANPVGKGNYTFQNWLLPMADINEVETVSHNEDHIVVDVRSSERFNGENEPIDLIAGHIPGAINIPFSTNLNNDGTFLSAAELKTKYSKAFKDIKPENIIVHCGSGVTACHTLLALDHAGICIPKLYIGSWSEWSRTNRPIATNQQD